MDELALPLGIELPPGLPIIKWEKRSKRVITIWIDRPKPGYYSEALSRVPRGQYRDLFREDDVFRTAWIAERDWWWNKINDFPRFECYAVYPAMKWIHATIKIHDTSAQTNF